MNFCQIKEQYRIDIMQISNQLKEIMWQDSVNPNRAICQAMNVKAK